MSPTIAEVALGIIAAALVFRAALGILPDLIRWLSRDLQQRLDTYDDEALEDER